MYVHIYINNNRVSAERFIYVYVYAYMYVHIYLHIYIYIIESLLKDSWKVVLPEVKIAVERCGCNSSVSMRTNIMFVLGTILCCVLIT
jgi:hypothetical protein